LVYFYEGYCIYIYEGYCFGRDPYEGKIIEEFDENPNPYDDYDDDDVDGYYFPSEPGRQFLRLFQKQFLQILQEIIFLIK
jgi:hypothetical protein